MILVAFRSRLRPEAGTAYKEMAQRIAPIAAAMPGYISHKAFTAEDGERVTLVEYENEAAMQAWGRHSDHLTAKAAGRREFFETYRIQVCQVLQDRGGSRPAIKASEPAAPAAQPSPSPLELMLSLRQRRWQRR
jgi:heme-degrading monooxygenase HmoA